MFPGQLQFNSSANRLIFDAQYLDKPLVRSDSRAGSLCAKCPADVMTIPGSDSTLEAQIERIIGQRHPDRLVFAPMHELAKELGLAARHLHRRLKESATSYQKIKDNLRGRWPFRNWCMKDYRSRRWQILWGLPNPRSFTRAFKHWTGLTPREYCKQKYGTKLAEMAPLTYK